MIRRHRTFAVCLHATAGARLVRALARLTRGSPRTVWGTARNTRAAPRRSWTCPQAFRTVPGIIGAEPGRQVFAPAFTIRGSRTWRVVGLVSDLPLHDDGEGRSQGPVLPAWRASARTPLVGRTSPADTVAKPGKDIVST